MASERPEAKLGVEEGGTGPCSLEPAQLEERLAMVRREIAPHARGKRRLSHGLCFEFDATPELRARLERLAELERQCCAGLDFRVCEDGARLRFEILGVDPASDLFDALTGGVP